MRRMKYMLMTMLLAGIPLLAANLKLQVSSTRVVKGQSVTVKLIAEGSKVRFPVLKEIAGYPVENLRKSSKLESRFVNGKFSSKQQKILSFSIYPQKTVTIPSLKAEVDGKLFETKPVTINVVKGGTGAGPAAGYALEMRTDKKQVYLGEPFVLIVDAVEPLSPAVVRLEYVPPTFKGFYAKPLGGEKQIRKGRSTIHRLKYLLIPQKEGVLTISPASVRVGLRDLNAVNDPFGIFGTPIKWYSLRSSPLKIRVKPLPASADLVGHFRMKGSVDHRKVEANKPVNYTLEISGEGSLEDLEDPVFDIPGVTVYSDDAKVQTGFEKGKLHSIYRKKYVFISDRSFVIPSVKLRVFDPVRGKVEEISTPEIPIEVSGGATGITPRQGSTTTQGRMPGTRSANTPATVTPAKAVKKKATNPLTDEVYYAKKAYEEKMERLPWYIAASFVGGMLLASVLFLLFRNNLLGGKKRRGFRPGSRKHYSYGEALKILYPHLHDDPEVEETVRKLYAIQRGEKVDLNRTALDRLTAKYDTEEYKK
ncbi:BatD family protein [Nitratifractor sp.]